MKKIKTPSFLWLTKNKFLSNSIKISLVGLIIFQTFSFLYSRNQVEAAQALIWNKIISNANESLDPVMDGNGNMYVLVRYLDFDLEGDSQGDIIRKYSPEGNLLWEIMPDWTARDMAVDTNGNLYTITKQHYDYSVSYDWGLFLNKFDTNGNLVWSSEMRSDTEFGNEIHNVATDSAGYIYVDGQFNDYLIFDGGSGTLNGANQEFIAKFDSSGNTIWNKITSDPLLGMDLYKNKQITVDSSNNVYTVGYFFDEVDFGDGVVSASGGNSYITKRDSSGNFLWKKTFGGHNESFETIKVDSSGNVYAISGTTGVTKYDTNGTEVWTQTIVENEAWTSYSDATSLAVDDNGNVYVKGAIWNQAEFGDGTTVGADGEGYYFIYKLNSSGTFISKKIIEDTETNHLGKLILLDSMDKVYVIGYFSESIDLGDGVISRLTEGANTGFLLKLNSGENVIWDEGISSFGVMESFVDSDENIYEYLIDGGGSDQYAIKKYDQGVDGDGVPDTTDNCPSASNPLQEDTDNDGIGNACDSDDNDGDNDGVDDGVDNCPINANPVTWVDATTGYAQLDNDNDGIGDVCDSDNDNDGVENGVDNCPLIANINQNDIDSDDIGDVCDDDKDNDGDLNSGDNCPVNANPGQEDADDDGIGDACDDTDGDGIYNPIDNCPNDYNDNQADEDHDGIGDECDPFKDNDADGIDNDNDNCPEIANDDQEDLDTDGIGDACDTDNDNDGVENSIDNCPNDYNDDQADADNDGIGDICDAPADDNDSDGIPNGDDNCPNDYNPGQEDEDNDGIGDECEIGDLQKDGDQDGVNDWGIDNCSPHDYRWMFGEGLGLSALYNPDQMDSDGDGIGDVCDIDRDEDGITDLNDNCPNTYNPNQENLDEDWWGDVCDNDDDNDFVIDGIDNCQYVVNRNQLDTDGDGVGDACADDYDGDGVLNGEDNCEYVSNVSQSDHDSDGNGDVCDKDDDNDKIIDNKDNCQFVFNPQQDDNEMDGIGNACDSDDDNDGVLDGPDNCPLVSNSGQEDGDTDGYGDVCDYAVVCGYSSSCPEGTPGCHDICTCEIDGVWSYENCDHTGPGGPIIIENDNECITSLTLADGLTSNIDLTSYNLTGRSDRERGKSVVSIEDIPGIETAHSLCVPKKVTDTEVRICPEATDITGVDQSCTNGVTFKDGESKIVTFPSGTALVTTIAENITINGQTRLVWRARGVLGTGGVSLFGGFNLRDQLNRLQVSENTNHEIQFGTENGIDLATDSISLDFATGFVLTSITANDIDFEVNDLDMTLCTSATQTCASGAGVWGVTINAVANTITFAPPTDTATDAILPGSSLHVEIGTNAQHQTVGTHQIQNPGIVDEYEVSMRIDNATATETGEVEIPIVDDDTVNISGYLDTSISFDIDTTTETGNTLGEGDCDAVGGISPCDSYEGAGDGLGYVVSVGEMTTNTVNKSNLTNVTHADGNTGVINSIYFDLETNAIGGAAVTAISQYGGMYLDPSNIITSGVNNPSSEIEVTEGSGRYGIQSVSGTHFVNSTSGTVNIVADCDGVENGVGGAAGNFYCGMTTLEPTEIFNTNTAPVEEARVEFGVGVAPSSTNATGTYEDFLTFIATGTF